MSNSFSILETNLHSHLTASVWKLTNRRVKTVKNHKVTDQDEHFGTNPEKGRAKFNGKKMKKKKERKWRDLSMSSENISKCLE